jgi:hypothetical protein
MPRIARKAELPTESIGSTRGDGPLRAPHADSLGNRVYLDRAADLHDGEARLRAIAATTRATRMVVPAQMRRLPRARGH